jgi:hypothetical protein
MFRAVINRFPTAYQPAYQPVIPSSKQRSVIAGSRGRRYDRTGRGGPLINHKPTSKPDVGPMPAAAQMAGLCRPSCDTRIRQKARIAA